MVILPRVSVLFVFFFVRYVQCQFGFLSNLFGGDYKEKDTKFKCYSTYELVEVSTYEIHYNEVRHSELLKLGKKVQFDEALGNTLFASKAKINSFEKKFWVEQSQRD